EKRYTPPPTPAARRLEGVNSEMLRAPTPPLSSARMGYRFDNRRRRENPGAHQERLAASFLPALAFRARLCVAAAAASTKIADRCADVGPLPNAAARDC